mmetsp:Transcript_13238/g.28336  ORF Transcript_13238/g.28336 Transcript_13238/m.28336 type:complete len:200 (+) Transcript_13238:122-721(+)
MLCQSLNFIGVITWALPTLHLQQLAGVHGLCDIIRATFTSADCRLVTNKRYSVTLMHSETMFTSHLCQGLSWVLATALHRGTYMHTRQQRCSPTAALLVLLLLLLLLYCRPSSEQVVPAHGTCAVMCHPPVYAFHVEVMGAGQAPQHLTGSVVTQADCTVRRVLLGSLAAAACCTTTVRLLQQRRPHLRVPSRRTPLGE